MGSNTIIDSYLTTVRKHYRVFIGLSIPIILVVYLMSLLNFGIVMVEYQGYMMSMDIQSILILIVTSMVVWLIAKAFKYVESIQ